MPEKIRQVTPPTGCGRVFFRVPILVYRLGLGRLFGERMLLLNHTGRKSGITRQAVLEVVHHDRQTDTYYVNVGFGEKSQWYQNLIANPNASIQVGGRKLDVFAEKTAPETGGQIFLDFVKKHPNESRMVNLLGYRVDGSDEDWFALGEELIFMALRPRETQA